MFDTQNTSTDADGLSQTKVVQAAAATLKQMEYRSAFTGEMEPLHPGDDGDRDGTFHVYFHAPAGAKVPTEQTGTSRVKTKVVTATPDSFATGWKG